MKRARGPGGRFLSAKERQEEENSKKAQSFGSSDSLDKQQNNNNNLNDNSYLPMQNMHHIEIETSLPTDMI